MAIQRIAISSNLGWKSFMKMVDAALPIQNLPEKALENIEQSSAASTPPNQML